MRDLFKFKGLISKDVINTGRQIEIDIARGLAVLFMVLVHVQMYFSNSNLEDSSFGVWVDFFGGIPAAPVFMFLMGLGFLYSKKADHRLFIRRGIYILIAGYVLNFFRESLPALVDYISEGDEESLNDSLVAFIDVDILQFAGLAMIFFGLFKWMNLKWWMIFNFVVLFASLNYALSSIQTDGYFLSAITSLFWGSTEFSEFPFLTWIFYPIMGYVFAQVLIRCRDKKKFYDLLFIVAGASTILCYIGFANILNKDLGMSSELTYYHHNFYANIVYCLFVLTWISLLFRLVRFFPNILVDQFKRWSKNVTEIYFIHWILIGWLEWLFYPHTYGIVGFMTIAIGVFMISDWTSYYLRQKQIKLL